MLFPDMAVPIYTLINSVQGHPSPMPLPALAIICLSDKSHTRRSEVTAHLWFDLSFAGNWLCWTLLRIAVGHHVPSEECLCISLAFTAGQ